MSAIDLAELRAEMEAEREWREAEIRLLRNHLNRLEDEQDLAVARKALVVMLYAHFEGACKALLSIYTTRVSALGLTVAEVNPALASAALEDVFGALRDQTKKCKEFARALPDDTALHRFARDREFVEVAWSIGKRPARIDRDRVVDTEANLKPVVLRKLLYRLGLDPGLSRPWEAAMNLLLQRRNDVAHGTQRAGLSGDEYALLDEAVRRTVDELVRAISDAVAQQRYLVANLSAIPVAT